MPGRAAKVAQSASILSHIRSPPIPADLGVAQWLLRGVSSVAVIMGLVAWLRDGNGNAGMSSALLLSWLAMDFARPCTFNAPLPSGLGDEEAL
jgi:hypothetical protein